MEMSLRSAQRSQGHTAKRAKHPMFLTIYSEIAQASPNPSYVLVPRPSSSIIISESLEADLSIVAVSSISAIKVLKPLS